MLLVNGENRVYLSPTERRIFKIPANNKRLLQNSFNLIAF